MTADAFQAALLANPDDVAGWSAYADYLLEHDDPRGELMRVQLALEDAALPTADRRKLQADEDDLIDTHGRDILGKALAVALLGKSSARGLSRMREIRIRRGVLYALTEVKLTPKLAATLATDPAAAFLGDLGIRDAIDGADLVPLAAARFPPNLRRFRVADVGLERDPSRRGLAALLRAAPRLESLYLNCRAEAAGVYAAHLPNLRELRVGLNGFAANAFAANASFAKLESLDILYEPDAATPGDYRVMFDSPHLKSLARVAAGFTRTGDDGCRELVASRAFPQLERLDLERANLAESTYGDIADALETRECRLRELVLPPLYGHFGNPGTGPGSPAARLAARGVALLPSKTIGELPPPGRTRYRE